MQTKKNKIVGQVLKLFLSQTLTPKRIEKEQIELDENGVYGDKFHSKDSNRSVLISSLEGYNIAFDHQIAIEYGLLGENILIDYNIHTLEIGTQVKIGEVVLEITQNCTLCKSLTKINNKLPKLLKDDRGVFAKVIQSGVIHKNDKITLL
jgi:MOSC domain-containing protein YiiM